MCAVRHHSTTASLASGDIANDEDASCSGRHTDMDSVPRISLAESFDSSYNELGDEDSR